MKFFSLLVLIGATLVLGIVGIFAAKLLLGIMPRSLVVVIPGAAGFALVWTVIRLNTGQAGAAPEK
jgi:lipopolysaccharide export LptBFGC system permease protein LptF